jgi:hypothetical protein
MWVIGVGDAVAGSWPVDGTSRRYGQKKEYKSSVVILVDFDFVNMIDVMERCGGVRV